MVKNEIAFGHPLEAKLKLGNKKWNLTYVPRCYQFFTFLVSQTLAVTESTDVTAMMTANFQYIWIDHRITV